MEVRLSAEQGIMQVSQRLNLLGEISSRHNIGFGPV